MKKLLIAAIAAVAVFAVAPLSVEAGPNKKHYNHKHSAHHKNSNYKHSNHTHGSYHAAPRNVYSYRAPVRRYYSAPVVRSYSYGYRPYAYRRPVYPSAGYVSVPGFSFFFGGSGGYCH